MLFGYISEWHVIPPFLLSNEAFETYMYLKYFKKQETHMHIKE